MKEIIVVSGDWQFRALVRAELRERGYAALGWESLAEAEATLAGRSQSPAALVFDATSQLSAAVREQLAALATRLPLIVVLRAAEPAFTPPAGIQLLRRPLTPDEVAATVVHACSRAGAVLNGSVVAADGGFGG